MSMILHSRAKNNTRDTRSFMNTMHKDKEPAGKTITVSHCCLVCRDCWVGVFTEKPGRQADGLGASCCSCEDLFITSRASWSCPQRGPSADLPSARSPLTLLEHHSNCIAPTSFNYTINIVYSLSGTTETEESLKHEKLYNCSWSGQRGKSLPNFRLDIHCDVNWNTPPQASRSESTSSFPEPSWSHFLFPKGSPEYVTPQTPFSFKISFMIRCMHTV